MTGKMGQEASNVEQADQIIARLGLQPHPEGGWYRQTWVGPGAVRASGTAILFLLQAGEVSHWHRVDADEIWIFNAGAPLILSLGTAVARQVLLGPEVLAGQVVQQVVPAGWWQAARSTGAWSLVSCTVSPGFRYDGFELAEPGFDLIVETGD
jgi:predicted cupin superfamily sugar epimerase